jgi:4-methyl-5(b-hydroxyethyl)-thiazole monophosphate biosynthesis
LYLAKEPAMYDALLFLTDGFEEIEALATLDILRRGGCGVPSVSLTGSESVTGRGFVTVKADMLFGPELKNVLEPETFLIIPGGPGVAGLKRHGPFLDLVKAHHKSGGNLAAICAGPTVLGMLGILEGKTAVCYPGHEGELSGAKIGTGDVETDGNIITSKAAGTTFKFALEILKHIKGAETAEKVRESILAS